MQNEIDTGKPSEASDGSHEDIDLNVSGKADGSSGNPVSAHKAIEGNPIEASDKLRALREHLPGEPSELYTFARQLGLTLERYHERYRSGQRGISAPEFNLEAELLASSFRKEPDLNGPRQGDEYSRMKLAVYFQLTPISRVAAKLARTAFGEEFAVDVESEFAIAKQQMEGGLAELLSKLG